MTYSVLIAFIADSNCSLGQLNDMIVVSKLFKQVDDFQKVHDC